MTILTNLTQDTYFSVLTNGLSQVTGNDIIQADKGTLLGAIRVLPHEMPKIKTCIVDIGYSQIFSPQFLLSFVINKNHYISTPNFALRFGYLWKEEISPIYLEQEAQQIILDGDVILISGGLGGIALAIAKEISKYHKVKFILASKNNFTVVNTKPYTPFQTESINFIKANNCTVEIHTCDISDTRQVSILIQNLKQQYQNIAGVIHTAGVPPLGITEKSLLEIEKAMKVKTYGAENLFNALKEDELKFFVMTSSLASLIGDIGRIEYCAANSYIDTLSTIKTKIQNLLSINWLGWSDIGMATKSTNNVNKNTTKKNLMSHIIEQNTVTEAEGAKIFYDLINQSKSSQIAVSKIDITEMKKKLLEEINSHEILAQDFDNQKLNFPLVEQDFTVTEKKIANIFYQILGCQNFSKHDSFFELGGNSISSIRLISKLNLEFTINLTISLILQHNTIHKLAEYLESESNKTIGSYKPIVKLNNTSKKQNIFMIHPGLAGCEVYNTLAHNLTNKLSCYGIDSYNLYNKNKITDLNMLAKYYLTYIDEVMHQAAQENYQLFGWSLGGKISLEIAYILEQRDNINVKLYLLDPIISDNYLKSINKHLNLQNVKDEYLKYALSQGYDQTYAKLILSNIEAEHVLGQGQISGLLTKANIILFKAMQQDKTLSPHTQKIYQYLIKCKYNNVDTMVKNIANIRLVEVKDANHGNIIHYKNLLLSEMM